MIGPRLSGHCEELTWGQIWARRLMVRGEWYGVREWWWWWWWNEEGGLFVGLCEMELVFWWVKQRLWMWSREIGVGRGDSGIVGGRRFVWIVIVSFACLFV